MNRFRPGRGYPAQRTTEEALRAIKLPSGPAPGASRPDDARRQLAGARKVARELVRREREHLGAGPEGHLNLNDLAPLLHALNINPEETL